MSVAIMGQLLIARTPVLSDKNFKIHQIEKKTLIQASESFRSTLFFQISEDSFEAFMKARKNMYRIELKMEQISMYVADCVEFLKKENTKNLLRSTLDKINRVADDVTELLKEVFDDFHSLGQLIRPVIETILTSLEVKKKEITDEIGIGEKIEAKFKMEQHERIDKLLKNLEGAEKYFKEKRKDLDDTISKSKLSVWRSCFCYVDLEEEESLEDVRKTLEKAENKVKKIKEKVKEDQKEVERPDEHFESLKGMRDDIDKVLDRNETLQILNDGLHYLGQYQDKWSSMHRYFNKMRNDFTQVTEFSAGKVEENAIEELNKSVQMTLEFCAKMHHSSKMYVQVFDRHTTKIISLRRLMLCIHHSDNGEAQNILVSFCEKACNGIKEMYKKGIAQATRDIEDSSIGKCQ